MYPTAPPSWWMVRVDGAPEAPYGLAMQDRDDDRPLAVDPSSCVFCEVVAGVRPAHVVFSDESAMAFLDLFWILFYYLF